MFLIRDSDDVEIYSSTGLGAIQGFGYEFHKGMLLALHPIHTRRKADFLSTDRWKVRASYHAPA